MSKTTRARTGPSAAGSVPPQPRSHRRGRRGGDTRQRDTQATAGVPGEGPAPRLVPPPPGTVARWVVSALAILVAAVGAGYGLSVVQEPVYGAEAEVLYRVAEGSGARAERDLATKEVILQGRAVLQPVADEAGMAVEDLQERLSVTTVGQSDVLRITVADPDPDQAVDLARAVSEHYVEVTTEAPGTGQGRGADLVEEQIEELTASLDDVGEQLAALTAGQAAGEPGAPTQAELQAESDQLAADIAALEAMLGAMRAGTDGAEARLLTSAYLLEDALAPQPLRAAMVGALAGMLVIGILGAVLGRRWGYL